MMGRWNFRLPNILDPKDNSVNFVLIFPLSAHLKLKLFKVVVQVIFQGLHVQHCPNFPFEFEIYKMKISSRKFKHDWRLEN